LDSLEVGAVEIERKYVPDHRQRCQEVPKRIPATLAVFLRFCVGFSWRGGLRGCICSFQALRWCWGALKDKIHAGGF